MIIVSPTLVYLFGLLTGRPTQTRAIAIYPFILVRSKEVIEPWILNHEKIHLQQQRELLIIGFFILALVEALYALIYKRSSLFETYLWQSAEQEAFLNQNNFEYLKTRKMWSQFQYLKKKHKFSVSSRDVVTVL